MPTPDGTITTADLCTQSVVERILADEAVASIKLAADLESDNWDGTTVAAEDATTGWRIERNTGNIGVGAAYVRGALSAATISADDITTGTLAGDIIYAGRIDVAKVNVGNFENLIADPTCYQVGQALGAGVAPSASTFWSHSNAGGQWLTDNTIHRGSGWSISYDQTGQTSSAFLNASDVMATPSQGQIAASEGDMFYFEAYARKAGTGTSSEVDIGISYRNSSGTQIGSTFGVNLVLTQSWQKVPAVVGTAPANTAYIVARARVFNDGVYTEVAHFTDFYLRRMLEGTLIVDGTIQADKIEAGTLTSTQLNAAAGITGGQIATTTISGGNIITGAIDTLQLAADAVTADKIEAGTITSDEVEATFSLRVGQVIRSTAYTPGSVGWSIDADGDAEFNNVIVRGQLIAGVGSDVDWSYIQNVAVENADITSLAVSKITGGTYGNTDITFASGSDLKSSNYAAGTLGWQIQGNGDAEFNDVTVRGNIQAGVGSVISAGYLVGGIITGIQFQTASSGARLVIDQTDLDRIKFYSATELVGTMGYRDLNLSVQAENGNKLHLSSDAGMDFVVNNTPSGNSYRWFHLDNSSLMYLWRPSIGYGQLLMSTNGSLANPQYSFISDENSGLYRSAADVISLVAGGVAALTVGTTLISTGLPIRAGDGSVGSPSYSFDNDPNTGFYRPGGADIVNLSLGGTSKVSFQPTQIDFSMDLDMNGFDIINRGNDPAGGGWEPEATSELHMNTFGITEADFFRSNGAGTAGAPEFQFGSDTDTGLYSSAIGSLNISAASTNIARFNTTDVTLYRQLNLNSLDIVNVDQVSANNDDAAGSPAYSWNADLTTGMFRQAASAIGFATGGLEQFRITTGTNYTFNNLDMQSNDITNLDQALPNDDAVGSPAYSWEGDTNTGMFRGGLDGYVRFASNGVEKASIGADINFGVQSNFTANVKMSALVIGTGSFPLYWNSGTDQLMHASSSRRYKKNIKDLKPAERSMLVEAIRSVRPRWFDGKKGTGFGEHRLGMIAEEAPDFLVELLDGEPASIKEVEYDTAQTVAIQDLYERIEKLEKAAA